MNLTLPYPPSANRYWRVFGGRVVKSPGAREYQRAVAMQFRSRHPFAERVSVSLRVYRPRKSGDLDNSIKVLLDALKGVAFADDKQVKRIEAEQFDDKTRPRVEVVVVPLEQPMEGA